MTVDEFLDIKIQALNRRYQDASELLEEVRNFSGLKRRDKRIRKKSTNSFGIYWVGFNLNPDTPDYDNITLTFLKNDKDGVLYPAIILTLRYYHINLIALEKVWFRVNKMCTGSRRSGLFNGDQTIRDVITEIIEDFAEKRRIAPDWFL